jgi:hypothetical protein
LLPQGCETVRVRNALEAELASRIAERTGGGQGRVVLTDHLGEIAVYAMVAPVVRTPAVIILVAAGAAMCRLDALSLVCTRFE